MTGNLSYPQWTQRLVVGWLTTALTIGVGTSLVAGCSRPIGDSAGAATPSSSAGSPTNASTPTPAPTPTAVATTSRTTSSPVAESFPRVDGMLQPEDVGPQWHVQAIFRGDWPTEILCRPRDTVGPAMFANLAAYDALVLSDQPPPVPGVDNDGRANWLLVARSRWAPGQGQTGFAYIRERMRACEGGTITPTRKVTIVDSPVVGDESFLVEIAHNDDGQRRYSLFLRRGDVTAEIHLPDDRQLAVSLGRRAAERACELTRC